MVTHPPRPAGQTRRHLRHIAGIFRQDRNPAARVYESIGSDSFHLRALPRPASALPY